MKEESSTFDKLRASSNQYEGWLYIGNDKCRYALGQPGKYNLIVFGINPSSATPEKLDPTIRKVRKVVEQDEIFDGWIMLNLYPLRSANPEDMPDKADKRLSQNNLEAIKHVFQTYPIWKVWAAWGNAIDTRDYYVEELKKIIEVSHCQWYHRGPMTRYGNPRHPLYMPNDAEFDWFPAWDYAYSFEEF